MAARSAPGQRGYCVKLLVALAVAVYVSGALATAGSKTTVAGTPALGLYQVEDQTHRRLRTQVQSTEPSSDERASDGLAKIVNKLKPANQKAADNLFARLNLHTTASNLFETPKFQKWVSSVESSYGKSPQRADAAMILTLRAQFRDEDLVKMLQASRDSNIARRMEDALLKNWIGHGKSADGVFKLLMLDEKADDVLKNPAMSVWVAYVEKLGKNPYELLLRKLEGRYSEEDFARMLSLAKRDATSGSIAGKLETAQLESWFDQGRSADYMFKLLRLDQEGSNLFKNPVLITWASYVARLDRKDPYASMLLILKTRYSDKSLVPMLIAAKENRGVRSVATRLGDAQLKAWQKAGMDADDVFTLFRLDKDGDNLFDNDNFYTWVSYARRQGWNNPDKAMLSVLKTHYSRETLTQLLAAAKHPSDVVNRLRNELWLSQGKTVGEAFRLLKLDRPGKNVFESPELEKWVSYVTKVNKGSKGQDEFAAITTLENHFQEFILPLKDTGLAKMLSAAKIKSSLGSGDNEQGISELQRLQFKQWLKRGETPGGIHQRSEIIIANQLIIGVCRINFYYWRSWSPIQYSIAPIIDN